MRLDGEVLDAGVMSGSVSPTSSSQVFEKDFSQLSLQEKRETIFVACLLAGGEVKATQLATFVRNKHLNLVNPQLKAYLREGDGGMVHIQVDARYLARFVELSLDDADVVFSDNYFDVLPGELVHVECTKPEGWTLDDIGKSLTVFSLYDSFA
jgi:beta-mannosidase